MSGWKYQRIFGIGEKHPEDHVLNDLLEQIKRNIPAQQSVMPATYTYFGQLIDHDLNSMRQLSRAPEAGNFLDLGELELDRNPSLDLGTLYGDGLDDPITPFNRHTGQFLLCRCGDDHFLLRDDQGRALISDSRNDENLFISRLLVLFMLLHNRFAAWIREEHPEMNGRQVFAMARKQLILIYQHVVLHDFAKMIVPCAVYKNVIGQGQVVLSRSSRLKPSIPLEFAAAAFRLHSWVRAAYFLKVEKDKTPEATGIDELLNPDGLAKFVNIGAPKRQSMDQRLDWKLFFHSKGLNHSFTLNRAIGLSPVVSMLGNLMPSLSMKRGYELRLASGQAVREKLRQMPQAKKLFQAILPDKYAVDGKRGFLLPEGHPLRENTPLWFYLMLEAANENYKTDHLQKLGKLGGWLIADTLYAAMQSADVSLEDRNADEIVRSLILRIRKVENPAENFDYRLELKDLVVLIYPATNVDIIPMKKMEDM